MSSDAPPDDEERMSLGILVKLLEELESDAGSDAASEFMLRHLLDMLSLDDDDDDNFELAHPSMSDQQNSEWQRNILGTPSTALHTVRAPVHLQAGRLAGRVHQLHALSGPNCWIGLSVGWPQTDVSFRHFGMVHWSRAPYISITSPYVLPRTLLYLRTPLGLLNGVPEYDITESDTLFYPESLLSLSPL